MREAHRVRLRAKHALCGAAAVVALACGSAASAQEGEPRDDDERPTDIIVTAPRGTAVTTIAPVAEFDADAIAAIGATTMPELLTALRGTTQSADGSDPILLINGQRVSGYQEVQSLPPDAIQKVEVLPEQAALKFGFPPTRRVVNFITKRNFRQIEARVAVGGATSGGAAKRQANLNMTRLRGDARLTLGLEYRRTKALYQDERDIDPDPEVLFDALGNVTGTSGGEVDPGLSAAAGQVVTVAPVPEAAADRGSLAGFAAGANQPRPFDQSAYRTLAPGNEAIKGEMVLADKIGTTLAGSLNLTAEQVREQTVGGLAAVKLLVPDANPYSPFSVPVVLNRYLDEVEALRGREKTTTLHGGATLRGALSGWRWDLTGSYDQKQVDGRSEIGVDATAANAAIAGGANPFAPLDPALLGDRQVSVTRLRTRTMGTKAVATNTPVALPAGKVNVTATVEAERATAYSDSRGASVSELSLGRTRLEGGLALEVPLTSRREGFFDAIGDLSLNASINQRRVSGFGSLRDSTFGATWSPIEGLQFLATLKRSAAAPDMASQLTPELSIANVPVFDYTNGRTEIVTLIRGGNPDLAAERRSVTSLGLTLKPWAKKQISFSATYEDTVIRDQTGTIYAITPEVEGILPDLFVRDGQGRLVSVAYRPTNFYRAREKTLKLTLNAFGQVGKAPPPPAPGSKPAPRMNYYAGIGPTFRFANTVQLRPGAPELDLLDGETINGGAMSRAQGYTYAGFNYRGNGVTVSTWYQAPARVRNADPASDLRFGSIFKLNFTGYIALHPLFPKQKWTEHTQLRLEINDLTNSHQRVTDRNGNTPSRYQPDFLNSVGRTVTLTLRKTF